MDRDQFLAEVKEHGRDDDVAVAGRIFEWADAHGMRDVWEPPSAHGHVYTPVLTSVEWEPVLFGVGTTPPRLFVSGEILRRHHPFKIDEKWRTVLDRVYDIPGVVQTEKEFYPHIRLRDLSDETSWSQFFDVVDWMVAEIRRSAELGLR